MELTYQGARWIIRETGKLSGTGDYKRYREKSSASGAELYFQIREPEKASPRDFRGGSVVETAPCSAGDTGSVPGGGSKIPHAMEK